ncbi:hypothetical protein EON83_27345 [bacterium]|nr:MAG: hypothetical protein EON83_27345 [bacterium]
MNGRRKVWILAASVGAVVLFGALWKAAAPFRARRQFEAQAVAQLANTKSAQGNKFHSLRVMSFRYDARADAYDVQ